MKPRSPVVTILGHVDHGKTSLLDYIREAKIPFIVALNKTDLPDANPNKVKNDLLKHDIQTEDKGGTVLAIEISAKTGKGVDELLEAILLQVSELNLQYDENAPSEA